VHDSGISFSGVLVEQEDLRDGPIPYQMVRPAGQRGNCFATEYRPGAEYLLLLSRSDRAGLTPYWAPLAPLNEQIRGPDDPWVAWVREQLEDASVPHDTPYLLERGRAGPFELGMTAGELFDLADRLGVSLVDLRSAGRFGVQIHLQHRGPASIVATLVLRRCEGRRAGAFVPDLEIRDPRFRTREGVGIGSTFAEALKAGWVDERGLPGPRAFRPDGVDNAVVQFDFEPQDEACPTCRPADDARVSAMHLSEPAEDLSERTCVR
jgi:hypothetical protein